MSHLESERVLPQLALMDFSALPRFGLKGAKTRAWLEACSLNIGDTSNRAYPQSDGSLAARLSPGELLFLCDPAHPVMSVEHDYFSPGWNCYTIRRRDSHYWFAISGKKGPSMLAKLCGVNFDPSVFHNHDVAQTQVARTNGIVLRNDMQNVLCYYLLGDNSYFTYMYNCLLDAVCEYEGRVTSLQVPK